MSAVDFFNAARVLKRELTGNAGATLDQQDVDEFNVILRRWRPEDLVNPTALGDAGAFFSSLRAAVGPLAQAQVEGIQTLLQAFGVARWPVAYAAYGLATGWRETNKTMQPVREAYWLSEDYRKAHLRYYPWYGRGYVQLTWEGKDKQPHYGYARADEELGLNGRLLANPDLAMQPDIAAKICVKGMEEGWFCTKKLSDYLPATGPASLEAYKGARHIINGTDHADEIAINAKIFEKALIAGQWK